MCTSDMGAKGSSSESALTIIPRCRFCGLPLSSATTHEGLCTNLQQNGLLKEPRAATAYRAVDRVDFVPAAGDPYVDAAVPLGAGAQISAPHVHASALDLLLEKLSFADDQGDQHTFRVLDIGFGSGYMCAVLAQIFRGRGTVLAIEHMEELVSAAQQNIAKSNGDLLNPSSGLELRCQDAEQLAQSAEFIERFDIIHCGAALHEASPWFTSMLCPGGRAVVPIGPTDAPQWLCTVDKGPEGEVQVSKHIQVLFVPVTSQASQQHRADHWDEVVDRCIKNSAAMTADDDIYS